MDIIDKLKGSLYGFSIGDAMGATTEFMDAKEIKEKFGQVEDILGGGWLNLRIGDVTDDTQMSICVMKALMKNDIDNFKRDVAENFSKWLDTEPKDVGNQCFKAINFYKVNQEYIYIDNTALGNGSLMRALPCALMNSKNSAKLNVLQGEITHNNEICADIIKRYTATIKAALKNEELENKAEKLLPPSGYVINTFNNALYWSGKERFEECIIGAVNHGGDADTIAAIAGGIAGAEFGYSRIPSKWTSKINKKTRDDLDEFLEYIIKSY